MGRMGTRGGVRCLLTAVSAVIVGGVVSACSSSHPVNRQVVEAASQEWPLRVDEVQVYCAKGTTGPEISFTLPDSETRYPISPNALFALNGGAKEYPGSLASVREPGTSLRGLMGAAYVACDRSVSDYDVEVMNAKA